MKFVHAGRARIEIPRLDIRHLAMLVSLADTSSIARSAAEIGITASALSHRMTEAQRRAGVALFTRQAGRLHFTPAGETLLTAARAALAELAKAERDAHKLNNGIEQVLRFAVAFYGAYYWFPSFLMRWRLHTPSIHLEVVGDVSHHALDSLLEGKIDLAILPFAPSTPEVSIVPLMHDELVLIMRPEHRLERKKFVVAEDLFAEDFVVYTKMVVPGHEYDRLLSGATRLPRLVSAELPEVVLDMVAAGLGTSILSRWAIAPSLHAKRVSAVPVTRGGLPIVWYAAVRAEEKDGSPAIALQEALVQWWTGDSRGNP